MRGGRDSRPPGTAGETPGRTGVLIWHLRHRLPPRRGFRGGQVRRWWQIATTATVGTPAGESPGRTVGEISRTVTEPENFRGRGRCLQRAGTVMTATRSSKADGTKPQVTRWRKFCTTVSSPAANGRSRNGAVKLAAPLTMPRREAEGVRMAPAVTGAEQATPSLASCWCAKCHACCLFSGRDGRVSPDRCAPSPRFPTTERGSP